MINEQQEYSTSLKADVGLPLAPLIDMVFLIVIFFMVNASMQFSSSILVELPEVQNSSSNTVIETVITVTESLAINIESESISQSVDLITMQSILSSNSLTKVVLRAVSNEVDVKKVSHSILPEESEINIPWLKIIEESNTLRDAVEQMRRLSFGKTLLALGEDEGLQMYEDALDRHYFKHSLELLQSGSPDIRIRV